MGFHFFYIEIPYYDFVIYDFVIAIFSATLSASVFGLAVAEAGVRWGFLLARIIDFGYLSVGQWIASIFAELAARVPRKMLGFEEIVINFANRKSKTTKQPNNNTTASPSPSPLPQRVKKEPHPQPLSEWRGE